MQIKYTDTAITVKISESEMYSLSTLGGLHQTLSMHNMDFTTEIITVDTPQQECLSVHWHTQPHHMKMSIYITHRVVDDLIQMGKNRHGISTTIDTIKITLQVDIKSDTR